MRNQTHAARKLDGTRTPHAKAATRDRRAARAAKVAAR